MSNGKKKEQSPSPNSEVKKYPKAPEWLLEEYEWMKKLAARAEAQTPPQFDTYWHESKDRVGAALRDEYGLEVD